MVLDRKTIVDSSPDTVDVPVPEWGGDVRLKRLDDDATEQVLAEKDSLPMQDGELTNRAALTFAILLLSKSIVNGDKSLQFDDEEGRDFLRTAPLGIRTRLVEEAMKLNALGTVEVKKN